MDENFVNGFEKTAFITRGVHALAKGVGAAGRGATQALKGSARATQSAAKGLSSRVKDQAAYTGTNIKRGLKGKSHLSKADVIKQRDLKAGLQERHRGKARPVKKKAPVVEKQKPAPKYKSMVPESKPKLSPEKSSKDRLLSLLKSPAARMSAAGGAGVATGVVGSKALTSGQGDRQPPPSNYQQFNQNVRRRY